MPLNQYRWAGPTAGNANFSPQAIRSNQGQAMGARPMFGTQNQMPQMRTAPGAPAGSPLDRRPAQAQGQMGPQQPQDYSGGNPYLTGLNYTTNQEGKYGSISNELQNQQMQAASQQPGFYGGIQTAQGIQGANAYPTQPTAGTPNPYANYHPGQATGPLNASGYMIDASGTGRTPVTTDANGVKSWQQTDPWTGAGNGQMNYELPLTPGQPGYEEQQAAQGGGGAAPQMGLPQQPQRSGPGISGSPMDNGGITTGQQPQFAGTIGGDQPVMSQPATVQGTGAGFVANRIPDMVYEDENGGAPQTPRPGASSASGLVHPRTEPQGSGTFAGNIGLPTNPTGPAHPTGFAGNIGGTGLPGSASLPTRAGTQPALPSGGAASVTGGHQQAQPAQPVATGVPNTYGGNFTANRPAFTPGLANYSSANGPQAGAVGQSPAGWGPLATINPNLTQITQDYWTNAAANLNAGVGATPYGQQNTFLPSWGQSGMLGQTAPINPQYRAAQGAINSQTGDAQGVLAGANPNALRAEYNPLHSYYGQAMNAAANAYVSPQQLQAQYGPLQGQAGSFAQYGGLGGPGAGLSLRSQYGALGNAADPTGQHTGAAALQGISSGEGFLGQPGQYLNSATQSGGYGQPGALQSNFASGQGLPGQGGSTLSQMSQSGNPIDQTPAWRAMVEAQQRNIGQNAAQIAERAAQSGNLAGSANGGGTGYNSALSDYYNQATKDQNALLAQMTGTAGENAASRQLQAGGQLFNGQLGTLGQLGQQQQQAGLYGAGAQLTGANVLQNNMARANEVQNQNQQFGVGQGSDLLARSQTLPWQTSNASLQGMLGAGGAAQSNLGQSQQTPYGIYNNLNNSLQGWTGQAAGLGSQMQGYDQAAADRQYQEFLRTQPEYSPLLGMINQNALYSQPNVQGANPSNPLWGLGGNIIGGLLNRLPTSGGNPGGGGGGFPTGGGGGVPNGGYGGYNPINGNYDPWGSSSGWGFPSGGGGNPSGGNTGGYPNTNFGWGQMGPYYPDPWTGQGTTDPWYGYYEYN